MNEFEIMKKLEKISRAIESNASFSNNFERDLASIKESLSGIYNAMNSRKIQKVVCPDEVEGYLEHEWIYAGSFYDDFNDVTYVVVEYNEERERR